jgi:hypothetical protein
MVSGSSLAAYWLSNYLADVIFHTLGAAVALLGIWLFDVEVPGIQYLFGLVILANPVFVYFVSFFFDKDESGSLAINIIFFIFGIIAPISLTILQIISVDMYNASQTLRWAFYPIPIFSLTYGYISIINIDIINYMIKTESGEDVHLQPFDHVVAGPSYYFLLYCIPVYWVLLIMKETNIAEMVMNIGKTTIKIAPKMEIESVTLLDEVTQDAPPTER